MTLVLVVCQFGSTFMLVQTGITPEFILFFDCPEDEMERRVLGRNQVNLLCLLLVLAYYSGLLSIDILHDYCLICQFYSCLAVACARGGKMIT